MYDPDRSQTITKRGDVNSWAGFVKEIKGPLAVQKGLGGAGIRILTQTISSPTLADQLRAFAFTTRTRMLSSKRTRSATTPSWRVASHDHMFSFSG